MLTDAELHQLFETLKLPEIGRARVRHVRDSLPSRAVRSNKVSGKTRYTPIKMPFVVEAEAVSTEYAAIVEWDHDSETLEYYPQPAPLKITYLGSDRVRPITTHTTADLLRIRASGISFVECKREEELERLATKMPGRYRRDTNGRWSSPPAEIAAAELGCTFEIRSSKENNWSLHENLELLKDFHIGEPANIDVKVAQELSARLLTHGWISVFELVHHEPSVPADQLYALIAARHVYFPIATQRLSDQERAFLFRDEVTFHARSAMLAAQAPRSQSQALDLDFKAGTTFDWDSSPWQVLNDGKEFATIQRLNGNQKTDPVAELAWGPLFELVRAGRIRTHAPATTPGVVNEGLELLRHASTKRLQEALWRQEVLEDRANPVQNPCAGRALRTIKYWLASYRKALQLYGNGLVGLLPNRNGNRKPKASIDSLDLAREVIEADWETIRRKKRLASFGRYLVLAPARGLTPISYRYFCTLVKQRSGHKQSVTRIGEKAAYDIEPQFRDLEWTTPRHGVRPWHIVLAITEN